MGFGLYTAKYENTEQIFHASTGRDFYNAVAGADWVGLDAADYVYDEVPVELWRGTDQFFGTDHTDGAVHRVYHHTVCHLYRNYICL